jgi:hypothetical protein
MSDSNSIFEEIELASKTCHNCDNCVPIGKRDKRNAIRDGRFDTKEKCCETGRRETGCPVATKIQQRRNQEEHDATIAAKAKQEGREEVLKELGITLNSRIAKMEILDSKNPSSLRKGIVMAYRDIKEWERQNRTMRKRI